jgi:hypothetical protein
MNKVKDQSLITTSNKTKDFGPIWSRYFFYWSVSIFIFGFIASSIKIPVGDVFFFQLAAKLTPAITKWANASIHYEFTLLLWIYSTYSILFISLRLIFLTSVKKALEKPWKAFFMLSLLLLLVIFPFIDGSFFGIDIYQGGDTLQHRFYLEDKVGIVVITWMIGGVFMFAFPPYIIFFIELFKLRGN